ncbi:MAG TPA: pirin family protein [Planctomycetota bacterium]|nr:pirin family protein [Planctomycetota bacterium]
MITLRRSNERGHADHGWLDTYHTFSFADYFDPRHMGYRDLRVINEDIIAPGEGFGTHPHRDMEIITYVIDGALEHRDSMGNGAVLNAGDVQVMTAGSGITHSEFNHSKTRPVHLTQIWIKPQKRGLTPGYGDKSFGTEKAGLQFIASPDARDGSLKINQDARVAILRIKAGEKQDLPLELGRYAWVQVLKAETILNGKPLQQGDGASVEGETKLTFETEGGAEVLLFDLA